MKRRRRPRLDQKREPRAAVPGKFTGQFLQKIQRFRAGNRLPVFDKARGAVGIVKIQDGRLRVAIRAAMAAGELVVALNLDGPAFLRLDHQRNRPRARGHGGGVILRLPVNVALRLHRKRHDLFLGTPATTARQPQPRQQKRRGHDLHEMPPGDGIMPFGRALGKLAFHPLLELGSFRQLIETPPVFAAVSGFGRQGRRRLHTGARPGKNDAR
ncbi:MAG: hypothetical protein BWX84_02030 [Verrucomicrobia bacterium ADurb.Bin118]|nr:MAG: hypothetical protein BWX84_02030 [Verrucomicrobia bacterium ADurb.Bin118]